ncbi:DnaD domain-containing protein [Viridibacillus arvi]|uniref:DnaD domain-containing protein n=1 Tax=Viridibacillus arvi TaxID=263475 RepID=UPI00187BBA45|nr:DnaD domain protein [Viridibacillus sp. JNUCC-6]QOV10916.1 DnaD domain protein [Viridibacillus sp. JNUCC-6]
MAKFRLVHTTFWNDPRVVEEMTAEDKYFFLYLLTNENTSQVGIYQITKRQIAFDLGYSTDSASALLQRFIEHHKLIRYNLESREIAIKNWGKYNLVRGGKPILDCVKSELKTIKDTSLIQWVGESIPNESIRKLYESYYVTYNDTPTLRQEIEEYNNTNGSHVTYHNTPTISGQYKDKQQEEEQEEDIEKDKQQEKEIGPSGVYAFYESNIGPLKPFIGEEIGCEIDEHGAELVLEALKESVTANARNKVKYAQGILRNWHKEGVTSLHDLEMKRNRGENNGNVYARSNGQSANQNGNDPFAGYSSN